jgi:hypothetical protein
VRPSSPSSSSSSPASIVVDPRGLNDGAGTDDERDRGVLRKRKVADRQWVDGQVPIDRRRDRRGRREGQQQHEGTDAPHTVHVGNPVGQMLAAGRGNRNSTPSPTRLPGTPSFASPL